MTLISSVEQDAMGMRTYQLFCYIRLTANPIFSQVFLVWQLLLSSTILRKRYSFGQIGGCLLVIAGVVVVVPSRSGGVVADTLEQSGYLWPLVMIGSTFFVAVASILKELVFQDGAKN